MNRAALGFAAIVLVSLFVACSSDQSAGGQDESTPTATILPFATNTPTPTPTPIDPPPVTGTPVDFTKGCGPPLSSRYCELWYRQPPPSCPVSGSEVIRSDGQTGIGTAPFWMVISPVYRFTPEEPKKRIWTIAGDVQGKVTLTGHRLDGPQTATFPQYERDDSFREQVQGRTELVLLPPYGRAEEHRTLVFYRSAGCWAFTAQIGTESVTVVQYLYAE